MRQAIAIMLLLAVPLLAQDTKPPTSNGSANIKFSASGTVSALPDMVQPTIKHHDEVSTQHYDRVEISCPKGYEGHFVDIGIGFDGAANLGNMSYNDYSGPPGYTICFSREFMEKIRANTELLRARPIIKPV